MHIKLSHYEALEICQRYLNNEFDLDNITTEIESPAPKNDKKEIPANIDKISPDALDQLWAHAVRPLDVAGELMPAKLDLAKLYYNLRFTFTNEPISFMEARNFVVCHRHDLKE